MDVLKTNIKSHLGNLLCTIPDQAKSSWGGTPRKNIQYCVLFIFCFGVFFYQNLLIFFRRQKISFICIQNCDNNYISIWWTQFKHVIVFRKTCQSFQNWNNKSNVGNRGYITSAILFSVYYCVFCRLSAFHTNDFPSGTGLRNSHTYTTIMRNYRATLC